MASSCSGWQAAGVVAIPLLVMFPLFIGVGAGGAAAGAAGGGSVIILGGGVQQALPIIPILVI